MHFTPPFHVKPTPELEGEKQWHIYDSRLQLVKSFAIESDADRVCERMNQVSEGMES